MAAAPFFLAEGLYRFSLFFKTRQAGLAAEFELYAIGASTMRGSPYSVTVPALVSELLGNELAGRRLRVRDLSVSGESIYPQALALERRVRYRRRDVPAAVLIYSGHNEYFSEPAAFGTLHRAYRFVKENVLQRSLLAAHFLVALEKRFDVRGPRDMRHYERYLRRAIESARAGGAVVILSTLASNTAGIEPAMNVNDEMRYGGMAYEELRAILAAGAELEALGRPDDAVRFYEDTAKRHPSLAPYAAYRSGKRLAAAGDFAAARARLRLAADTDAQQYRARSSQNELIRRLAAEYRAPVFDAEAAFESASPHGLTGNELFIDIMHPNRRGYLLLARGFAERLAEAFGGGSAPASVEPRGLYAEEGPAAAEPFLRAGFFIYLHSRRVAGARERLALSEARLKRALELDPASLCARYALGMVSLARLNGDFAAGESARWMDANRDRCGYGAGLPEGSRAEAETILSVATGS